MMKTAVTVTFSGAVAFDAPLSGWDVARVRSIERMFRSAAAFDSDLGGWDTAAFVSLRYAFFGATAFGGEGMSCWETAHITDM